MASGKIYVVLFLMFCNVFIVKVFDLITGNITGSISGKFIGFCMTRF